MSLLADALQPSLVSGIFGVSGKLAPMSLSDVITAKRAAYGLDFDHAGKCLNLDFRDSAFVSEAAASDCSRLAISCMQTASHIATDLNNKAALPWFLVRLYYAAFYAAHVVVRLLGKGCCWLDSSHVSHIDALAKASGVISFPMQTGAYRCSIEANATRLEWTKIGGGSRSGAHESLWWTFHETLKMVSQEVLRGPLPSQDAQAVFAQIDLFLRFATINRSFSWLSRSRNEFQYRLMHDVWYPTTITKREREHIQKLATQWEIDPMNIDLGGAHAQGLLVGVSTACVFTISICRTLLLRINERSTGRSKSFVHFGPIAYLNGAKLQTA